MRTIAPNTTCPTPRISDSQERRRKAVMSCSDNRAATADVPDWCRDWIDGAPGQIEDQQETGGGKQHPRELGATFCGRGSACLFARPPARRRASEEYRSQNSELGDDAAQRGDPEEGDTKGHASPMGDRRAPARPASWKITPKGVRPAASIQPLAMVIESDATDPAAARPGGMIRGQRSLIRLGSGET